MPITIPDGIVPVKALSTEDVLYGDRVTSWRWEVLEHAAGTDHLIGYLDGVVERSESLSWQLNLAVKGTGNLKVADLPKAEPGFMTIQDVSLMSARLRPVLMIEGLPEIPFSVFLPAAAPEAWSGTGRVRSLELLDRATVLDQDQIDESFTVDAGTPILAAVAAVVASAGESINVDAAVTDTLSSASTWPATTTKLQIVNDLLGALNYSSLWVDGVGNYQATPYVVPAKRSLNYELLTGVPRELVDGESSIYMQEWERDVDLFSVPNKVIAVQAATGDAPALVGSYTNTDPDSPFSYPSRGRWITKVLDNVETPAGDDAAVVEFLEAKAQASLIASSSVQAAVSLRHLPVPIRVSDVMRFGSAPAGIDARHVVASIELEAHPLGLMKTELREVVDL